MAEFLLEIFSEEIPARMQTRATEEAQKLLHKELETAALTFSYIKSYITPRRFIVVIDGLPQMTEGKTEERRGPKIDAPENAIQGFLKATGITQEACQQKNGYYYATLETKARQTRDILPTIVQALFAKTIWQKSMCWTLENGQKSQNWVRPVRSVLTVFDGQPLSFNLPSLGLTTNNKTQGHRFLKADSIEISSFADYKIKLEEAFVMIDAKDRQKLILEGLESLAHEKGLRIQPDESLLQEVEGLIEYPVPLLGQIDPQFMRLPSAVLSTAMRVHQKYFTLQDKQGKISPYFGVVANTKGQDGPSKMIAGYERVLRARLSDADFFYEQDLKVPLEELGKKLTTIIFQAKLGTLSQKVERLEKLMLAQGKGTSGKRAARLSKIDLLTSMVKEFPELQGIMGEIYATAQQEDPEVALAIREHYQPQGPQDQCPQNALSISLGLADKIDTLVGFFGIGEEPTGSRDPFALRRSALGIIRLIRENNFLDFPLFDFCTKAVEAYQEQGTSFSKDFCPNSVLDFMNERLKVLLRSEGIRHDCLAAVIDRSTTNPFVNVEEFKTSPEMPFLAKYIHGRWYNICSLSRRAEALQAFLETSDGQALSAAFKRVNGIMEDEVEKDKYFYLEVNPSDFIEPAETNLYTQLEKIIEKRETLLDAHDYTGWMAQLATLRPMVDSFFDTIKVNHENKDIRANRLRLLGKLLIQMYFIGALEKIEG